MGSGISHYQTKEAARAAGITEVEIDEYCEYIEDKIRLKIVRQEICVAVVLPSEDAKKNKKKQSKANKKANKKAAKRRRKARKKAGKAARDASASGNSVSEKSDDEEKQAEKYSKQERNVANDAAGKAREKAKSKAAKDAAKAKLEAAKQAAKAQRKADKAKLDATKLKLVMTHFHAPFQVWGAPKPHYLEKCDEIAAKFAAALASHGQNEDLINLFAADGAWQDPVGGPPPYVGTEKLKARIAKLPPMESVEVKEVFYSMSPKIFLAKTEVTFKGKKPFIVLDSFELDDNMNIVKLDSHFHAPSALKGAPRPAVPDALSQRFARALFTHGQNEDLINLFTADAAWHDPVGGPPPCVGTENLKDRINKLSPMESVEVKEVFCSMSPKVFLTKTQITFKDKKPLIVLNKFVSSYD